MESREMQQTAEPYDPARDPATYAQHPRLFYSPVFDESETTGKIYAALIKFQGEAPHAPKDSSNPHFKSHFSSERSEAANGIASPVYPHTNIALNF